MRHLLALLPLLLCAPVPSAAAQDFYDIDVLRTVDLQFHDANWLTALKNNYQSQTEILADMTVEGTLYPDVGVRIRGNTSYTALPAGSEKFSLNIKVDMVHPDQDVMGINTMNFNNAFTDPTFCREVVFSNILSKWIPTGRANHVVVTLNGQNWGVYANVQQYGKKVLKKYFDDASGMRVKCANNPFGPGLQYQGSNPSSYNVYEIKDDGGLVDPVAAIIAVCNVVDTFSPANWKAIDKVFAIDPSIWTVVLENLFSDDDSYVHKGCDFVMYRNPTDERTYLHQTDGNESWRDDGWDIDFNFNQGNKPFLNNVLSAATLRARYMAHARTIIAAELDPVALMAEFDARKALIDAAVQADPKKLYTYQNFVDNFKQTVVLPGGFFGGPVVGLEEYVTNRLAVLSADPELGASTLDITNVATSGNTPGQPVYFTADVSGTDVIAAVDVFMRGPGDKTYRSIAMKDDGLSGDGAAGDGHFGALLPFPGVSGAKYSYYVRATAQNTFLAQSFMPAAAELQPNILAFQSATSPGDIVINEFLAGNKVTIQDETGSFEDYVELYNRSGATIDLSGMYMSDSLSTPTEWQIPAGTMIGAGQTLLIWADEDLSDGPLHADFKLSKGGDEIGLWDTDGMQLLDSVVFGAQENDISTGFLFDGSGQMFTFTTPTPDMLNNPGCGLRAFDQLVADAHTLKLEATGSGAVGSIVNFTATGLLPSSSALMAYGFGSAHFEFSPGLVVLVDLPTTLMTTTDATGSIAAPLALPAIPALAGLSLYFQVAGADATSALAVSNAIQLAICP